MVVGEQDADHRAAAPTRRSCPSPGSSARRAFRRPARRGRRAASGRRGPRSRAVARARRRRSRGRRRHDEAREPSSARDGHARPARASACGGDVAQRLARDAVDERVAARVGRPRRPQPASRCPRARSGLSRSLERGARGPRTRGSAGGSRRAACAGRARPGAACRRASRSTPRLVLVPAARGVGGQRRQPERDAGEVLHDAVVQVGGDPAALAARTRRSRSASSRSRSSWPRCSRRASDHASGTWKSSSTSRPADQRRRERAEQPAAFALTELKRW